MIDRVKNFDVLILDKMPYQVSVVFYDRVMNRQEAL
jgi:hypothetical protein